MGEIAAAYEGCRTRIGELVRDLDDAAASARVPTCPEWTVHDLVAHVTGVVDDALAGRLDGVATEPWTAAQVDARRDAPIAEMLDAWNAQAPAFEALLDAIGDPGRQAVADVVTHEHDLRAALRAAGARDSDAISIAVGFVAPGYVASARRHELAARVEASDGSAFGDEAPDVTVRGTPFELLRAMTGRRSVDQLRGLDWTGDVETALAAFTFGPFRPATTAIDE